MTQKIEIEFTETNYLGSKVFSSLADVLGLSVDLVSFIETRCEIATKTTTTTSICLATPTRKKSHIAYRSWMGKKKILHCRDLGEDGKSPTWKNKQTKWCTSAAVRASDFLMRLNCQWNWIECWSTRNCEVKLFSEHHATKVLQDFSRNKVLCVSCLKDILIHSCRWFMKLPKWNCCSENCVQELKSKIAFERNFHRKISQSRKARKFIVDCLRLWNVF